MLLIGLLPTAVLADGGDAGVVGTGVDKTVFLAEGEFNSTSGNSNYGKRTEDVEDVSGNVTNYGRLLQLDGTDNLQSSYVAMVTIGDETTTYPTLTEAFDAMKNCKAADNATIKVLEDITLTGKKNEISGVFTLDLNGHDIISSAGSEGGGVYYDGKGSFDVSGTPVIEGNSAAEVKDNFRQSGIFTIAGDLYEGAKISVTTEKGTTIAKAAIGKTLQENIADYFMSDVDGLAVEKKSNTLVMAEEPSAVLAPVWIGGLQLEVGVNYVYDETNGKLVKSTDGTYNAKLTGNDTDGYTLYAGSLSVRGVTDNTRFGYKSSALYSEADSLTIIGEAPINLTGADTTANTAGIYSKGSLTISSTSLVNVNGGESTAVGGSSYGIYCGGTLTVGNVKGDFTAMGGNTPTDSGTSCGVYGNKITIDGADTCLRAFCSNGSSSSASIRSSDVYITLNAGEVQTEITVQHINQKTVGTPFKTDVANKVVKYTDNNSNTYDKFNDIPKNTIFLKVTIEDYVPAPKYHTVSFYTNGGVLSGEDMTTVTANSMYTMRYQEDMGMTLPTPTRQDYKFAGWYDRHDFSAGSGPYGSIGKGSTMDMIFYAKWNENQVASVTINGTTTTYPTLTAAVDAVNNSSEGDSVTLKLLEDVNLTETLAISKNVTICSDAESPKTISSTINGHGYLLRLIADVTMENVIVDGGSKNGITASRAAVAVGDGTNSGTLTLANGAIIRNNNNTTSNGAGGAVCVFNGSQFKMSGGQITDNKAYCGGGIAVMYKDSRAQISGGSISKNIATGEKGQGGGIYVSAGTVTMTAGIIEDNSAPQGGGIYISGRILTEPAYFYLRGGSIQNNSAQCVGGVYVNVAEEVVLSGGSITGNTASELEGGMLVAPDCKLTISGSIRISGNTNSSGEPGENLYLDGYKGSGETYFPSVTLGTLADDAEISIYTWLKPDEDGDLLVATPASGSVISDGDLSKLSYEDSQYTLAINENGDLVLTADVSKAVINLSDQQCIYNGTKQSVIIDSVIFNGKTLMKDVDYEIVSGDKATNVDATTLTIRGKGAYTGTKTIDWSLQKATPNLNADFAQNVIDTLTNGVVYTGSPIVVPTTLKDGKTGMGNVVVYYTPSGSNDSVRTITDVGEYRVMFSIKNGQNYEARDIIVGTLTVKKADYTGNKNLDASVWYDKAHANVAVQLPALPDGAAYGTAVYCEAYYADNNEYGAALFTTDMSPVNGTTLYFSTYSVTTPGVYADIEIPVTGAKNYNNYAIVVRVTCIDRTTVEFSGIADDQSFIYNGAEQTPAGTLEVSNNVDVETLEVKYEKVTDGVAAEITGAPKDVGSYRVTYSVPDSNDLYKGDVTYSFAITPKSVTVSGITAEDKTYDGTKDVTLDCSEAVISGKEYGDDLSVTAVGAFTDVNAGNDKTVRFSSLTLGGEDAGNYVIAADSLLSNLTASIKKATAPDLRTDASLIITNNYAHTYEYDLSTLLPTLDNGRSYGSVTYGSLVVSLGDYYENGAVIDTTGRLTLPIVVKETDQTGSVGTVTVTVSSTNYEDFILTLNVDATNKKIPNGVPTLSKNELTYGETIGTITLSGSMNDSANTVSGTFIWNAPDTKPNAGSYSAAWTFIPDDQLHYAVVNGSSTIMVNKAAQSAPASPELESRTSTSITLKAIADNANGANAQYRINGGEWQDRPVFKRLDSSTEYFFEVRYAETDNFNASSASAAKFTTEESSSLIFAFATLTFETNGGSEISDLTSLFGMTVYLSEYVPVRDGYNFIGWYSDKALTESVTKLVMGGDRTVYAGWEKSTPVEVTNPFTDISKSDWFYDDVMYVYEKGLMNGTGSTAFSPYLTTTRGMIVTILYRMEGSPSVIESCPFADVKSGSYYEKAITWAAANGIVNGYSKEQFGPDDNITREQLATIIYRYAGYKGMETVALAEYLTGFADADEISTYAISAMSWAVGEGLISGTSATTLAPKGEATRAQVAVILHRFLTK